MTFPNWLRRARAPTNCLRPPFTSRQGPTWPEKTFWDLALSDIARQAPILSQTCLNSPHTSRQVKIFYRPTKYRLVCCALKWSGSLRTLSLIALEMILITSLLKMSQKVGNDLAVFNWCHSLMWLFVCVFFVITATWQTTSSISNTKTSLQTWHSWHLCKYRKKN